MLNREIIWSSGRLCPKHLFCRY